MNWTTPPQHIWHTTVTAEEIDRFNHVNNAVYIGWAMECGWAHSEALGLAFEDYERLGIGFVVREHHFTYHAAALLGDAVQVGTRIIENDGRLRLTRGFEMRRADGALLVEGQTVFVSMDMTSGKAKRMPPEFAAYQPE